MLLTSVRATFWKKKVGKNVTEFERKRHPFMLFHTDTTEKGTTVHRKM